MSAENWCCSHGAEYHINGSALPSNGYFCNVCGSSCDGWPGDPRMKPRRIVEPSEGREP